MDTDIPPSELGPILTSAGAQIASQKYAMLAFFTLFVYDYLLTLDDEIRYIWNERFTFVRVAFLMTRYYAMCVFILHIFANFSVLFDGTICKHYAPLQIFGEGIPLTIFTDLVIGLRVYALYKRNKYIGTILLAYIIGEFAVSFWIYSIPSIHPVTLPGPPSVNQIPALHLCLGSASSSLSNLQSAAYLFIQAAYDSITFGLIIFKTASVFLKEPSIHGGIQALIVKHGLLYYAIVFSAYFTWAMMTIFSPPGLKYAAASPTIMMSCVAVNKLTLSLHGYCDGNVGAIGSDLSAGSPASAPQTSPSGRLVQGSQRRGRRRDSWTGLSTFEAASPPSLTLNADGQESYSEYGVGRAVTSDSSSKEGGDLIELPELRMRDEEGHAGHEDKAKPSEFTLQTQSRWSSDA